MMRAPEQPSGCPSAMAPPFTFTMFGSSPSSRITARLWLAKASFSSTSSMSFSFRPAFSTAFGTAATGPMPMMRGSTPATAWLRMVARGAIPLAAAAAADMSTRHAPRRCGRTSCRPVTLPPSLNTGRSFASASRLVLRGCSSVSNTVGGPLRAGTSTGTISSLKRPLSMASKARSWLWRANASCSSREMPYFSARFSAVSPMVRSPYSS